MQQLITGKNRKALQKPWRFITVRQTTPEDAPVLFRAYQDQTGLRLFASNHQCPISKVELQHSLQKQNRVSARTLGYFEYLVHDRYSFETTSAQVG